MTDELKLIAVDKIQPSRYQPRVNFDQKALQELADSIDESGLLQPISVRRIEDGGEGIEYELIAGERRWRAFKLLEKSRIPTIVKEFDEAKAEQMALIENLQREDLSVIEVSNSLVKLQKNTGLDQTKLAQMLSKSRGWVNNMMRLQNLTDKAKQCVDTGALNLSLGIMMLSLPEEMQDDLAEKAVAGSWDTVTMRQNVGKAQKKLRKLEAGDDPQEASETGGDGVDTQYDDTTTFMVKCDTADLRKALVKELRGIIKEAQLEAKVEVYQGARIRQFLRDSGVVIGSREKKESVSVSKLAEAS